MIELAQVLPGSHITLEDAARRRDHRSGRLNTKNIAAQERSHDLHGPRHLTFGLQQEVGTAHGLCLKEISTSSFEVRVYFVSS